MIFVDWAKGPPLGGKSLETRRLTATSFGECCQSPFYEYCNMPCELFCCRGSERIEDPLKTHYSIYKI